MKRTFLTTTSALAMVLMGTAASASDAQLSKRIADLEAQLQGMEELKATIAELKQQVMRSEANTAKQLSRVKSSSGEAVSSFGDGFIPIPGTSTAIKFGGYAKLDATYDANTAYGADFVSFGAIPLDGSTNDDQDGEFNMSMRQTRLNLTSMSKTGMGDLKVFLEGDFYESRGSENTTNRHGFGLRQAYGQMGNWLIGQTWTNFMDMGVYPGSLDLIGSAGTTHIRQPQIRYTSKADTKNTFTVALENPSGDISDSTGNAVNTSQVPDLTVGWTHKDDWGHVALRGMGRQLQVHDTATGTEDDELGWAVAASGKWKFNDSNELFGRYAYGDGIGRYLFDVVAGGNSGAAYSTSQLESQVAHGGYANFRHYWTPTLQSNLLGGYVGIDNETNVVGTAVNEKIWSGHINLIWSPTEKVKFGLEYMHGERELENGTEGDLDRFLASAIYKF